MRSILCGRDPWPAGPPGHRGRDLRPCSTRLEVSQDLMHGTHPRHHRGPPMSRSVVARRGRERRARLRRRGTVLALVALVALVGIVVLPIGDDPDKLDPIEVSLVEYAFVPEDLRGMPGQTLAVRNDGAITHNLVIPSLGKGIELAPGGSGTMEVPAAEPGTYEIVCDLTGHTEAGMVGTIEIG
jgi:plastocyanin